MIPEFGDFSGAAPAGWREDAEVINAYTISYARLPKIENTAEVLGQQHSGARYVRKRVCFTNSYQIPYKLRTNTSMTTFKADITHMFSSHTRFRSVLEKHNGFGISFQLANAVGNSSTPQPLLIFTPSLSHFLTAFAKRPFENPPIPPPSASIPFSCTFPCQPSTRQTLNIAPETLNALPPLPALLA